jgi:hypothetical protein
VSIFFFFAYYLFHYGLCVENSLVSLLWESSSYAGGQPAESISHRTRCRFHSEPTLQSALTAHRKVRN